MTLTENDIWLAKQMEKHSKRYSFIVTHADRFYNDDDLDDNLKVLATIPGTNNSLTRQICTAT